MMDVVDFSVKVTAAVLRRLADGIDAAEKPVAAPTVVNVTIHVDDINEAIQKAQDAAKRRSLAYVSRPKPGLFGSRR